MHLTRHITHEDESPYAGISWKAVDVEICSADPHARVCLTDIEVPAHWSYEAAETFVRYYLRKTGIPAATTKVREEGVPEWLWRSVPDTAALMRLPAEERTTHETSARQVFARMAGMWAYWGFRGGYFDSEADARTFHDEACALLARQMMAPNSPQWFNAGLHWAYGMTGPAQGHFHGEITSARLMRSANAYERPQLAACFLHSVKDELVNEGGIMHLFEREVRAFKYGSGVGVNMSNIRASGENLSGGAQAAGLKRFLSVGDKAAGAISSGGLPRRAGKMVVVDIDHPEVLDFIRWKGEEQYKAAALITGARAMREHLSAVMRATEAGDSDARFEPAHNPLLKKAITEARHALIPTNAISRVLHYARQGYRELHIPLYSAQADSEVFFTIGAHQGKHAVRVNGRFMQAAEDKHRFALRRRTDGSIVRQEEAADLLDELAHAVWATGEPTIQFTDAIEMANPCPDSGPIRASTPASEYLFLDDTACPLAAINLLALSDAKGHLDTKLFSHVVRLVTLMLDISVGIAQYPSREMARRTLDTRPLGIGAANFGALIMRMGLAYDSPEARATAAAISGLLTAEAQVASAHIAGELGSFAEYDRNRETYLRLLHERRNAAHRIENLPQPDLAKALEKAWDLALSHTELKGARNAQLTCVPPTLTIVRVMDCETLGLSPVAQLLRSTALPNGGWRKSLSPNVTYGLSALGYDAKEIGDIARHVCGHGTLEDAPGIDHVALRGKGFGEAEIRAVEEALAGAVDIHSAFDPWVLGERFCRDQLKLTDAQLRDARFQVLQHLGFSAAQINEANRYACGAQHLVGAPHLNEQDAKVFATMLKAAPGAPAVSAKAQLAVIGAAQPFLTGGIAHTVLLPHDTSTDECRDLIRSAWQAGLKSLSVTRENCAIYEEALEFSEAPVEDATMSMARMVESNLPQQIPQLAAALAQQVFSGHRELPSRRAGFTQKANIGGHALYLRSGEYDDGSLGEVFLDMPQEPEAYRNLLQEFARGISVALQYGVPLSAFVQAFAHGQMAPAGSVEGSQLIAEASSVLDYAFRELQANYGHKEIAEEPARQLDDEFEGADIISLAG